MKSLVKTLTLRLLRENEHFEFFSQVKHLIAELGGAAALGVAELYTPFNAALTREDAALRHLMKSLLTPEIEKCNALRKEALRALKEGARYHFDLPDTTARHEKAAYLLDLIALYKTRKKPTYNELSSAIFNLLQDLDAAPAGGYVIDLLLTLGVTKLRDENNAFEKFYHDRINETAARPKYNIPAIRKEVDDAAWVLTEAIAAGSLRETYKGKFVEFINRYNALVDKYHELLARRRGKGKKAKPEPVTPIKDKS
ncbi:MAG: DUF6261 family protein [Verrucomicrobiales bacterium]|jgi:hypothetical protein|nr:DUF6261 family protein [Verrucomicrobiales bacterium]